MRVVVSLQIRSRSAIVWLCQLTGKQILKLTNKDYNENGLSELLALYGSAYNVRLASLRLYFHDKDTKEVYIINYRVLGIVAARICF